MILSTVMVEKDLSICVANKKIYDRTDSSHFVGKKVDFRIPLRRIALLLEFHWF